MFERTKRRVLDEIAARSPSTSELSPWWAGYWSDSGRPNRTLAIGSSGDFIASQPSCEAEPGACGRIAEISEDRLTLDYTVRWPLDYRLGSRRLRRIKIDGVDALVIEPLWLDAQQEPALGAPLVEGNAFVRDALWPRARTVEAPPPTDGPPLELK